MLTTTPISTDQLDVSAPDATEATNVRRSPLLTLPGAVEASGIDAGVAAHYGEPFAEQRKATRTVAVFDRSNRDVVVVPGVDRLPWLHSINTQHVSNLRDGEGAESLVLSPNGHVEQQWMLTELGDQVWLDVEPGTGPDVLGYLTKMQFMKRVSPADVSADWAVLSVVGPDAATTVTAVTGELVLPSVTYSAVALPSGGFVRTMPTLAAAPVFDFVIPREELAKTADALVAAGAAPAGTWAFEALRVADLRPRYRLETDHRTIPHEVGWIGVAVHLNKGCYRGQETVARVHNLGKPPRRLVLLHLSGEDDVMPPAGTPVEFGGRTVGFLGTAVQHHELGPIALAVIKRSLADDSALTVDGRVVSVQS